MLKLIARRVVSASWIPLFDGVVSVLLGTTSLGFLNPAGVPVVGLAFAAAGLTCESRANKRIFVFIFTRLPERHCADMLRIFHSATPVVINPKRPNQPPERTAGRRVVSL